MKNTLVAILFFAVTAAQNIHAQSASTFINEINYLASNPTEAGLEIAGEAGTNLAGWSVVGYTLEGTVAFVEYIESGIIPNQQNGNGAFWYDVEQTGNGGGLALVNAGGNVVQFLSYGTVNFSNVIITATEGAANGLTSEYVGTQLLPESSLQLVGTGLTYLNFLWSLPAGTTPGQVNTNQFFILPPLFANAADAGRPMAAIDTQIADIQYFTTEEKSVVDVRVFPNPTIDRLQITVNSPDASPVTVNLFDAAGKLVLSSRTQVETLEFDLMHLVPGRYILQLETAGQRFTEKIIKL